MSFTWLILIHWLHILSGIVWCGGQIIMAAAIWPALMRQPAPEARTALETIGAPVGIVLGLSEFTVLGLGIVRGTWLGPINSFDYLFNSSYGRTFLVAFTATILLIVFGFYTRQQLYKRVWDGDRFHPNAVHFLRTTNVISLIGLAIITGCMARLHFGV